VKILLDHNVPHDLRSLFPERHQVYTAHFLGWEDYENGELLRAALEEDFAVLVSLDTNLRYQRNLDSIPLGIVVLDAHPATLGFLKSRMDDLIDACSRAASNQEAIVLN
jgi:hypothetical protein